MTADDRFLLDNRERLGLLPAERGYLEALKSRFEITNRLMRPLPSTISAAVRASLSNATPQEQEREIRRQLSQRNARIIDQSQRVNIDTLLLHGFEGELDYLHGILLHPVG